MPSPSSVIISSTRVEEGHHDRVTVWNRGGNAGTLTVKKGDGAEVAARLEGRCPVHGDQEYGREAEAWMLSFDDFFYATTKPDEVARRRLEGWTVQPLYLVVWR